MLSDEALLADLAAGRSAGFTTLYERYSDALFRFALVVSGSRTIAEEATQSTFVFMIEHAGDYDAKRSPSALGWLYGAARNKVRSLIRDRDRAPVPEPHKLYSPSPETLLQLSGAVAALATAISQLSIGHREVVVLCGLQELDYATAAGILKVPVGTVRSRLSRARQQLHRALVEETGFTLEEIKHGI